MISLGCPDPLSEMKTRSKAPGPCGAEELRRHRRPRRQGHPPAPPTRRPPRRATGPAPSELEEVDEVLRRHGREAAVGVCGRAGVSGVLREEGTGVTHAGHQLLV